MVAGEPSERFLGLLTQAVSVAIGELRNGSDPGEDLNDVNTGSPGTRANGTVVATVTNDRLVSNDQELRQCAAIL